MSRKIAYGTCLAIVIALGVVNYFVLTSSRAVGRFAAEELQRVFGDKLKYQELEASLDGGLRLKDVRLEEFLTAEQVSLTLVREGPDYQVGRIALEKPVFHITSEWVDRLMEGFPEASMKDFFSDGALPRIVMKGGAVRVDVADRNFFAAPQEYPIEDVVLAPAEGREYFLRARLTHALLGAWQIHGELDLNTNQIRMELDVPRMTLGPDQKKLFSKDVAKQWEDWNPVGNIGARVRLDSSAKEKVVGTIYPRGLAVTYAGFPYPLEGVEGEIEFQSDGFRIRRMTAQKDSMRLHATGHGSRTAGDVGFFLRFDVEQLPLDDDLHATLGKNVQDLWNRLSPRGVLDVSWTVQKEPGQEVQRHGWIYLRGGIQDCGYPDLPLRIGDVEGVVEFRRGVVHVLHLSGSSGKTRVGVHGTMELGKGGTLHLDVKDLALSPELGKPAPESIRRAMERMKVSGRADVRLDLAFQEQNVQYDLAVTFQDTKFSGAVPLEEVFGTVSFSGTMDDGVGVLGKVHLTQAKIREKKLSDLLANLKMAKGEVRIEDIKATLYKGVISGHAFFDSVTSSFGGSFRGDEIDLREVTRDIPQLKDKAISGKLGFTLKDFKGKVGNPSTYEVKGEAVIRDGFLWDVPVFFDLFTLNPQKIFKKKNAFDAGNITFTVKKEVVNIKGFAFTSQDASVLGRGKVGFDGRLDMVMKTKSGSLLGVNVPGMDLLFKPLDLIRGSFAGVRVSGTMDHPVLNLEILPGIRD